MKLDVIRVIPVFDTLNLALKMKVEFSDMEILNLLMSTKCFPVVWNPDALLSGLEFKGRLRPCWNMGNEQEVLFTFFLYHPEVKRNSLIGTGFKKFFSPGEGQEKNVEEVLDEIFYDFQPVKKANIKNLGAALKFILSENDVISHLVYKNAIMFVGGMHILCHSLMGKDFEEPFGGKLLGVNRAGKIACIFYQAKEWYYTGSDGFCKENPFERFMLAGEPVWTHSTTFVKGYSGVPYRRRLFKNYSGFVLNPGLVAEKMVFPEKGKVIKSNGEFIKIEVDAYSIPLLDNSTVEGTPFSGIEPYFLCRLKV